MHSKSNTSTSTSKGCESSGPKPRKLRKTEPQPQPPKSKSTAPPPTTTTTSTATVAISTPTSTLMPGPDAMWMRLQAMHKNALAGAIGRVNCSNLSPVSDRIEGVQEVLDDLDFIATEEIFKIDSKYNKSRKAVYERRAIYIAKIPHFWSTVVLHNRVVREIIHGDEVEVMQTLEKLEVEEFENPGDGFRIKLTFGPNPYFHNRELIKEFHTSPFFEPYSTFTDINWKEITDPVKNPKQTFLKMWNSDIKGYTATLFSWLKDDGVTKYSEADDDLAVAFKEMWVYPKDYADPDSSCSSSSSYEDEEDEDDNDEIREFKVPAPPGPLSRKLNTKK